MYKTGDESLHEDASTATCELLAMKEVSGLFKANNDSR
jgi:hypothetical protein